MLRSPSLYACALITACAATQAATPAHNPESLKQYSETVAQRDKLRALWKEVKSEDRQYCELKAGDCMLQVVDLRDDMISSHEVPTCRAKANSDLEASCVADELVKLGTPEPATKYFKGDLWCLKKLTQCVTQHQEAVEKDARLALIRHRRSELEASAQGVALRSRVAATSEKIKYIRTTLPPAAESECQQISENSNCDTSITQYSSELDSELSKPDSQYDKKQAAKVYEHLTKVQASCYEPELKCLSKSLSKYGETNESRRWLQQNFDLLDKRQRLIEKAGDGAATPCLESGVASHQADIIQSYKAYVHEPVLYFRTQLHRSFVAMHKSQIDCLSGTSPGADTEG
jgi:hypothetical protein